VISYQNQKNEIAQEWATVKRLCRGGHGSIVRGGTFVQFNPPEGFRNLPLVLGYAVLDQVLNILISEGLFSCNSWMLGPKMEASETVLPWHNYALVDAGKAARNRLAHEGKLLDDGQCLVFIEAIEAELKAWDVITSL
jgi:hypothetical protein